MGKSTTSKYAVRVAFASGASLVGPMPWTVKDNGPATDAGLAAYVKALDASMAPGGVNAHLGPDRVTKARISVNVLGGDVVAVYDPVPR